MIIEAYICQYLNAESSVPAYGEIPEKAPNSFWVVEKLGSSTENCITSATIAVQSYAPSKLAASVLNEQLKGLMEQLKAEPEISSCDLNSDYDYTDTKSKRYRYQAVFDITYYNY